MGKRKLRKPRKTSSKSTQSFASLSSVQQDRFIQELQSIADEVFDSSFTEVKQNNTIKRLLLEAVENYGYSLTRSSFESVADRELHAYRKEHNDRKMLQLAGFKTLQKEVVEKAQSRVALHTANSPEPITPKNKVNQEVVNKKNETVQDEPIINTDVEESPVQDVAEDRKQQTTEAPSILSTLGIMEKYPELDVPTVVNSDYQLGKGLSMPDKSKFSAGERVIARHLDTRGVRYVHESTLPNLYAATEQKTPLPCDFIIDVDKEIAVIEYNGQQHYEPIGNNDIAAFSRRRMNDLERIRYSLDSGVPLLVISYKDIANIGTIVDRFIADVKRKRLEATKYTAKTIGYFSDAISEIDHTIHQKLFPSTNYPTIVKNDEFGYVALDENKIIIWDKDKLEAVIYDNKKLWENRAQLIEQNIHLKNELINIVSMVEKQVLNPVEPVEVDNTSFTIKELETEYHVIAWGRRYVVPKSAIAEPQRQGQPTSDELQSVIKDVSSTLSVSQIEALFNLIGFVITRPTIRKYIK